MEHKIGTRITLEVVEAKEILQCTGCVFSEEEDCIAHKCMTSERTDRKDILYKEIKEEK